MHVTTTPSVSYITRTDDFDCGIMISASHNPYYDNGIKLMNHNGEKMDEATILEVEKYIDGEIPEIPMAKDAEIGRTVDYVAGRNRYIGYLISLSKYSYNGKRVGLDVAKSTMIPTALISTRTAAPLISSTCRSSSGTTIWTLALPMTATRTDAFA